jgi:polyhydroxybutyrate depolymerase
MTWSGCAGGAVVEAYLIEDGGHTWPGSPLVSGRGAVTNQDIDASELIWQFFARFELPGE